MAKQPRTRERTLQLVDHIAEQLVQKDPKSWSAEKLINELVKAVLRAAGGVVGGCGGMGASPYLKTDVRNLSEEILRRLNKK